LPIAPVVDFEISPPSGCRPLKVYFTNLSRYAEPDSYFWTFGQGQGVSTAVNPTYTYYEPGVYTVTLRASNSAGVAIEKRKEFSIEVYDNPTAGFSIRPEEVYLPQPIFLANLSRGATTYQWDFGDGNTSTEFEPQHEYQEAGSYDVTLIAENDHGCTDTLRQENAVYVEKGGNINIPNAFTPSLDGPGASDIVNGNNYNDVFLPVFEGVTEFHMLIYNRWGELLFESRDKSRGWDGYFKHKLSAKDVYVYKLQLKFSDGRRETIAGDVTLLR
jgi:gliding motility-associated-like protein